MMMDSSITVHYCIFLFYLYVKIILAKTKPVSRVGGFQPASSERRYFCTFLSTLVLAGSLFLPVFAYYEAPQILIFAPL